MELLCLFKKMVNYKEQKSLSFGHIIIPFITLIVGLVLYYKLLWQPFGGWLYEHIASPVLEIIMPANPNILEGIIFLFIGAGIVYSLFFAPYIIFSGITIVALFLYFKNN